jgi:hypothetical protein
VEYVIVIGCVAIIGIAGYRGFGQKVSSKAECYGRQIMTLDGSAICGAKVALHHARMAGGAVAGAAQANAGLDGSEPTKTAPFKEPLFGPSGHAESRDVKQGNIPDCFVMGGAKQAAARSNLIDNLFKPNADGSYTVTFKKRVPEWPPERDEPPPGDYHYEDVSVTVKPEFIVGPDGKPVYAKVLGNTWPALFEQAVGNYMGWSALKRFGSMAVIFEMLTGKDRQSYTTAALKNEEDLAYYLEKAWSRGHLLGANSYATTEGHNSEMSAAGVKDSHDYSIEDVRDGKVKLGDPQDPNANLELTVAQFKNAFKLVFDNPNQDTAKFDDDN